jgi:tetratricopeptide (TPR) repeat protein
VLQKAQTEEYSRADIRRKFGISERQLRSWERQELIPAAETYSFSGLIAIQTLIKLREKKIDARQVARALASLRRKLNWIKHPLSELRIVSDGKKISVRVAGQKMEALTGQILFDFDAAELSSVKTFPDLKNSRELLNESELWFQRGLELEEAGAPIEQAVEAYEKTLQLNPGAAGAMVNLGTIHYRQRRFPEAERYYLEAIVADPSYPLAEFNLGNLYDEEGKLAEAAQHYRRALELSPAYADAHFNLALVSERTGETLKAVYHWKNYLKLDRSGRWAEIARKQLDRLRQATVISSL